MKRRGRVVVASSRGRQSRAMDSAGTSAQPKGRGIHAASRAESGRDPGKMRTPPTVRTVRRPITAALRKTGPSWDDFGRY